MNLRIEAWCDFLYDEIKTEKNTRHIFTIEKTHFNKDPNTLQKRIFIYQSIVCIFRIHDL